MMAVGARGSIEAVAVRHEEGAVTARLSTVLRAVTVPARTRPTEPQRPTSLRGPRISVVQNGGLSLSVWVPLDPSEETFEFLPLLPGGGQGADRLLRVVGMDTRLVQMEGMG